MCGLVAHFAYAPDAPPVDEAALTASREAMTARGPDAAGLWMSEDRRVGLGHRRLSIIDLAETGLQPMHDTEAGLSIVYNGEIYNFESLRRELQDYGERFRSNSDTEVLLKLYRRHGPAMVHRLRGMFAFALWDASAQAMFLARDPLGIKPLYVADDGRTLRAASQVKALLAGGGIDTAPEPAGYVGFALFGSVPDPFTLYKGIKALPAGTVLWLDRKGERRQSSFFTVTGALGWHEGAFADEAAKPWRREALGQAILDSVEAHLVADVPVGVFLSAGLDSASVLANAAKVKGDPIRTLTLGFTEFKGGPYDETPLARRLAETYGADHTERWVTAADFATARDQILADMDQPSIDGVNTWFVAREAAAAGLKVALSGLGGDELFGGYDTFSVVPKRVRRARPFALLGLGKPLRWMSAPLLKHLTSPKAAGLIEYGRDEGDAYLLHRGLFMPWELPEVLGPDMAREGWATLRPLIRLRGLTEGIVCDRLKISALEMQWYMRHQLLRDADWAGMAHSLEIRTPLVDVDLLEAVLPLLVNAAPPTKRDMALACVPPMPDAVLNKKKTGFFIPVAEWLGQNKGRPEERGYRGWAKAVLAARKG